MKVEVLEEAYLIEIRRLTQDKARLTARVMALEETIKETNQKDDENMQK